MFCESAADFVRPARIAISALSLALLCSIPSCSRSRSVQTERLAIVRFENLSGDPSLEWMGRAASEVISGELSGAPGIVIIPFSAVQAVDRMLGSRPIAAPGISAEQPAALAAGATEILYGRIARSGATLRLDGTLFGGKRLHIERTVSVASEESRGIIGAADSLARSLSTAAHPFETRNENALRNYAEGLESPDSGQAAQNFSNAVIADPNFGRAYVAWAQSAASRRDRTEADHVLELARARGSAIPESDQTRIALIAAELHGDSAATAKSLSTLARLNPNDAGLLRQLAQVNLSVRNYAAAAHNFRKAARLAPNDPNLANQLGYTAMYAGDLAGAKQALEKYAQLSAGDANPADSLGDVHFYLGQFSDAEKYYRQALRISASFNGGGELLKAAFARLMTGDVAGADGIFNEYIAARQNGKDPAIEYRRAEWEFLSGRRRGAMERMQTFAAKPGVSVPAQALNSQAYAQLAIWQLEMGDRARAHDFAVKAMSKTPPPAAAVSLFLTQPAATLSEWEARSRRFFSGAGQERARELVLSYALLLSKEFKAAEPLLENIYTHSGPEPQEIMPVLLAWAHIENGATEKAAPLIAHNPILNSAQADLFTSLVFPRWLFLRAEVLARQGRNDDAGRNYRLFLRLSGPDPQIFGEETRARQASEK